MFSEFSFYPYDIVGTCMQRGTQVQDCLSEKIRAVYCLSYSVLISSARNATCRETNATRLTVLP